MQPGREQALYLPHGQAHSGLGIGSLQTGQRGVLVGSVGMSSPSGLLLAGVGLWESNAELGDQLGEFAPSVL
jgi:hypothetical protein